MLGLCEGSTDDIVQACSAKRHKMLDFVRFYQILSDSVRVASLFILTIILVFIVCLYLCMRICFLY